MSTVVMILSLMAKKAPKPHWARGSIYGAEGQGGDCLVCLGFGATEFLGQEV